MPQESELSALYPADYHSLGRAGLLTQIRYDMRVRRLAKLARGEGAILDHGCGDGSFLLRAAQQLPDRIFFGYEIADTASTKVLADGRVTLIRGSFSDLLAQLPPCGVITMNHVIEHLPTPLQTLQALAERLVPGGYLEGQTPAAGSLEHKVFGTRWSGYHAPRHTVVFSERGLQTILERAGFEEVSVKGAFNPAALAVSLASLTHRADQAGRVTRKGLLWLTWLGLAAMLGPVDLLSGSPGIVNFRAQKRSRD